MISNLIRSLSTRSLITLSINLHRGQLLKRHSSINRLLSILHSDINRRRTITVLSSSEISLTITQDSLAILRHQLRIQVVLLTSNQTLIGHSVSNNRTIDNTLLRILRKLSLSLNRRSLGSRLFRGFGGRSLGARGRYIRSLVSTAVIPRETRLIRRQNALTAIRGLFNYSARSNNRKKRVSRLLINLYRRNRFKLIIEMLRNLFENAKSSMLRKIFRGSAKVCETRLVVGVTETKVAIDNRNGRSPTHGVRNDSSEVNGILLGQILLTIRLCFTQLQCQTDCCILILRIVKS